MRSQNWVVVFLIVVLTFTMTFADLKTDQSKNKVSVKVNNLVLSTYDQVTKQDTPPFITSGRTLMPLRKTFEIFGIEPIWDGETKTISVQTDHLNLLLTIGSLEAVVSGQKVTLDVAPVILGGRTYVPLRFISETFGVEPAWDGVLKQVSINTAEAYVKALGLHVTLGGEQIAAVQAGDHGSWVVHTLKTSSMLQINPIETAAEVAISQIVESSNQTTEPIAMYQSQNAVAYSVKLLDLVSGDPFTIMTVDVNTKHYLMTIQSIDTVILSTLFNGIH